MTKGDNVNTDKAASLAKREANKPQKPEGLKFTFAEFSLWDQLRINEIQAEQTKLGVIGRRVTKLAQEDPDAEVDDETLAQLDRASAIQREMIEMLAKCLKDVPADWLTENAPKDIPWGTVDALRYVKGTKYQLVQQMFLLDIQMSFLAGNSTGS